MCFLPWGHDRGHPQVPACIKSCAHHLSIFNCHRYALKSLFVFRPGALGAPLPARAILSMAGLSHGVIRVNTEDKNSALTVQDVGHVMPGGETPFEHFTVDYVSVVWTVETSFHLGNNYWILATNLACVKSAKTCIFALSDLYPFSSLIKNNAQNTMFMNPI